MPNVVELIFEKTCPNVPAARAALLEAFTAVGAEPRWREWEVSAADAPSYVHGYGSPTVLVNGRDVSGAGPVHGDMSCRVYATGTGAPSGVPPVAQIVAALRAACAQTGAGTEATARVARTAALLPSVGVALLPKLTCPACWPAYAGLLSSLGVGFFDYTPYMLPALLGFVAIALFALGFRARRRRGYGPFFLGAAAGAVLVASKFRFDSDALMWAALATLVAASLWNTWPRRATATAPGCAACAADAPA